MMLLVRVAAVMEALDIWGAVALICAILSALCGLAWDLCGKDVKALKAYGLASFCIATLVLRFVW